MRTVYATESPNPPSQDRLLIMPYGEALILVVADGAGGSGGGAEAAQVVVDSIRLVSTPEVADWVTELVRIDASIAAAPLSGETTAVVACLADGCIRGASVGDSGALVVSLGTCVDLTLRQERKPLLGSGYAKPTAFTHCSPFDWLLLASDGLLKYVSEAGIRRAIDSNDLAAAAHALVDSARLPSGTLQDDIAIVIAG